MRRYETIVIVDPDLSPEARAPLFERCGQTVESHGGLMVEIDEWGGRKLAYEIKKKPRGHYVRFDYCGRGDLVDELERSFRIDDRVLKYMTVLLEKEIDLEAVKEEIADAEAKKAASEKEAEAEAEKREVGESARKGADTEAAAKKEEKAAKTETDAETGKE